MTRPSPASIVINNYNYGRFLGDAVESALAQTYPATEVVVVDDGSTDESAGVIERFADRVTVVRKERAGQGSALNAGFERTRGEVICFLDADDKLKPSAVERAVEALAEGSGAKAHWPLHEINENGSLAGGVRPARRLPHGDLSGDALRNGPDSCVAPPTSGNAWSRWFLEAVLPIPEDEFRIGADAYLFGLAPLLGRVEAVPEPQAFYRLHGDNNYARLSFDERLEGGVRRAERLIQEAAARCAASGIDVDVAQWRLNSWFVRLRDSVRELDTFVPPEEAFLLIDGDQWGTGGCVAGRRAVPFPALGGMYAGPPADDSAALDQLERVRGHVGVAVVAWPAFWWLGYYRAFGSRLRAFECVLENDRLIVFDLRKAGAAR